jgi:DNA repair protein RadA/Sms
MSQVRIKRGRPSKKNVGSTVANRFKPTVSTMMDFKYDKSLFEPMPTGKKIDSLLSGEGGLMKGTNYAFVGDPGVGKTTVLLDVLADMQSKGNKVLFVSGEMNRIDMVGYVKRFPKFAKLPILFMGDYIENDPLVVLEAVLSEGYDCVLVDSFAEVAVAVVDYHGGTMKNAETKILNLLEKHNQAGNKANKNTAFMLIQQVTKGGNFAGSNRFKHMLTGMAHMKFNSDGDRFIFFSKNRRGGEMNKLFFSLNQAKHVGWLYTEPVNLAI